MKKIILLIIIAAFAIGIKAQDTINYIVIYKIPLSENQRIVGFRTQTGATDFLNNSVDSTSTPRIFDIRTKKAMVATFSTVEVQTVERRRKWAIRP